MATPDKAAEPAVAATARLRTAPGGVVQPVVLPMPKPGIVILVHGVNDVGEAFANQELGICLGLSERLGRVGTGAAKMLLSHAYYRTPQKASEGKEEDRNAPDPDAVYYRRHHTKAGTNQKAVPNSVVIPFYWGFREEEGIDPKTGKPWIDKKQRHGEYLDRHGNRLDKDSAKNGGPFANATNSIPAMWSEGFESEFGKLASTNTRPLLSAGPRNYMVLAAQRLAMMVRMIRSRQPDDTINVVAHSQGCLITLLANALLAETGDRPIDTFVMNHPPYGLGETLVDKATLGGAVETVQARLETLAGIVRFMTGAPHTTPSFSSLAVSGAGAPGRTVVTGKDWDPVQAIKRTVGDKPVLCAFNERDNRGKVYLYFCPDDQTVALVSVQGIGWQGVPDTVKMLTNKGYELWESSRLTRGDRPEDFVQTVPALDALGPGFKQRCFTKRLRGGEPLMVGSTPCAYELEKWHEFTWSGTTLGFFVDKIARAGFSTGQTVRITGETLNPSTRPRMGEDWDDISPIDASIAVTRDQLRLVGPELLPMAFSWLKSRAEVFLSSSENEKIAAELNGDNAEVDQTEVVYARHVGNGYVEATRRETPNEARRRWMNTEKSEDNKKSFHSSIVAEAQHSRDVTAYDLGIGQAKTIDDPAYHLYLCLVADWRTDWERAEDKASEGEALTDAGRNLYRAAFALRLKESGAARELLDQTMVYRTSGKLPECANCTYPPLVVTQTIADRVEGTPPRSGGAS